MKNYLQLIVMLSISTSSIAAIDVYPNPNLTDPSLATTFASQLRNMKIREIEDVIKGECNQFKEYVYLSIQNWESFKNQTKSADEAQQYSQRLIGEIPYRLSFQYTFPLGINIYSTTGEYIKQATLNTKKIDENSLLNKMYSSCLFANNTKYFEILSSTKYLRGNQSPFISENDMLVMFDPSNSLLKSLNPLPSKEDKLTPPNMNKAINFKPIELVMARMLINQDIRNSFIASNIRWIDYKKASFTMQKRFSKFMEEGGRNKDFAKIASLVKTLSPKITNNDENYLMATEAEILNVMNNSSLFEDPVFSKNLKDTLKKFNY